MTSHQSGDSLRHMALFKTPQSEWVGGSIQIVSSTELTVACCPLVYSLALPCRFPLQPHCGAGPRAGTATHQEPSWLQLWKRVLLCLWVPARRQGRICLASRTRETVMFIFIGIFFSGPLLHPSEPSSLKADLKCTSVEWNSTRDIQGCGQEGKARQMAF